LTIKLQYSDDVTTWRLFKIISMNADDCEFERRLHKGLNGNCVETPVGFRRIVTIEFEPLRDDKGALFFLYAWSLSGLKEVIYYTNAFGQVIDPGFDSYGNPLSGEEHSVRVTNLNGLLQFQHEKRVYFANSFTLELIEMEMQKIEDDGTTRIFKPVYGTSVAGITGNTFICSVNLIDQSSIEIQKYPVRFIHGDQETRDYGYRHALEIDTGPIISIAERQWIREFCLWKNKKIDTTEIDPYNGRVFDVVFSDERLQWRAISGIQEAKGTILNFKEMNLRNSVEAYTTEPSPYHEFILDTDQLDDTQIIIG